MKVKGRMGLGWEKTASSRKGKLREMVEQISKHDLLLTLVDKGVQGELLTMQLDFGWNNLIYNYKMSPSLLKFHLNSKSIHDDAHTPGDMSLWNMAETGHCSLCGLRHCNIKHILAVCNFSLNNKRFNWRHDNVLSVIAKALLDQIGKFSREEIERLERNWTCFRSSKGTFR